MSKENTKNEKPILFRGEMVRQILAGNKTQTRRIINPQPKGIIGEDFAFTSEFISVGKKTEIKSGIIHHDLTPFTKCPYGKIGDRLWVRETWQREVDGDRSFVQWLYKADNQDLSDWVDIETDKVGIKWKPSIFMPREASRIMLEIKNIRVEKLQDISEEDAKAEGVTIKLIPGHTVDIDGEIWNGTYRNYFKTLWDSINAKRGYGWATNPYVFVIEFEKYRFKKYESIIINSAVGVRGFTSGQRH